MTSEADDYLRSVHPRDTESSKTSNLIINRGLRSMSWTGI